MRLCIFNVICCRCGCRFTEMNYPVTGLFGSHRGCKCSCQSGLCLASSPVGSAPGLRIWILRVGRSTPTLVPASPCTLSPGLFTAETCRPYPRSFSSPPVPPEASSLLSFQWASTASFAFSSAIVNAPDAPSLQQTATVRRWRRREPAGSTLLRYKHWQPPCWEASTR